LRGKFLIGAFVLGILILLTNISEAKVFLVPEGEKYVGINPSQAIYVKKTGFEKYFNFTITQINETHWNVSYEINQNLIQDIKNCLSKNQADKIITCFINLASNYFNNEISWDWLTTISLNLSTYPMYSGVKLKFDRSYLNLLSSPNGSFYLIFPEGFKEWQTAKMGFGTITFTSGSQYPPNLAQRDDLHPYLNASIKPYSTVSTTINCSLYVDGVLQQTVNNIANNTVVYLNSSTLSPGDHKWYINCTDDNWATQTQSEVRTIGIGSNFARCAVLIDNYGSYNLVGDILNSGATYCIQIPNNHIVLDCQGHTVDGTDASGTYGIYVSRSSSTTTNITIKNCVLTDWYYGGLYLYYSDNNILTNITANSNIDYGLWLSYSDNNILTNITANSNYYGLYPDHSNYNILTNITANSNYYGLYLYYSDNNILTNITANSNSNGLQLFYSSNNTIKNSKFWGNTYYGIYLTYAGLYRANLIYNNLFNNTNNFYFSGTIYTNYWNTTKQSGINIWNSSLGFIGGNYWTNPSGNGYSDTCSDLDSDGFCDNPYTLATSNLDYLPIAKVVGQVFNTPPQYYNPTISYPSTYSPTTKTIFNITWKNVTNQMDKAFIEINFTGSFVNYTVQPITIYAENTTYGYEIILPAGTFAYRFLANTTANLWNQTNYNTITIQKATPSISLLLNDEANNKTITWLDNVTIKASESNYGDDDVSYCLYNSTSLVNCGSSFLVAYPNKSFANGTYVFVYNSTMGQNYTSSQLKYYLFVNKAWNQTDSIVPMEEYEYDLNRKGIPIIINKILQSYNSSVIVNQPLYAFYKFTINNTNNNTGLTTTFTNVFADFSKFINLTIWKNESAMENLYSSLPFSSPQYFIVNVSNITAYEESYSCTPTTYQTYKKYDCKFYVNVIESEITKTLPIYYYIPYSKLPEFGSRDKLLTNWYVDGKTQNTTYSEDDIRENVIIFVDKYFGSSSLEEGLHTFNIIYWIPLAISGGGGGTVIKSNVSFEVYPSSITKFADPGETKLIVATAEGYTFLIKNTGPNPIFIEIKIEGDYKDWVSLSNVEEMIAYQTPQYIKIEPGKTEGVKLYTKIPITASPGSYPITIVFMDRDSGIYKSATVNLIISPTTGIIYKLLQTAYEKLSYPIIFSTSATSPKITKEGIEIPARSDITIPIGWLLVILAYVITFYLIKAVVGYNKKKLWLIHLLCLGISLAVLMVV
jgi:parallel beta-helix repeat protein